MLYCNLLGIYVANDYMFILQGYEGFLLKVINKNGKNIFVSIYYSLIRYRVFCYFLLYVWGYCYRDLDQFMCVLKG